MIVSFRLIFLEVGLEGADGAVSRFDGSENDTLASVPETPFAPTL